MRPRYTARAVRSGRWWAIEIPDVRGGFSQARRLDQVEPMAREVVSLMLEVPEDSFDLIVEPDYSSLGSLRATVDRAARERETAAAAQEAASTALRDAVRETLAAGFTTRDAGALLGISPQRVSQIVRGKTAAETPRRAAEARASYGREIRGK